MSNIIYVSVDMEAEGPTPGQHSMLSLGADARLPCGTKLGTFSANLLELPNTTMDPKTMLWWAQHPQAFQATRINQQKPELAMQQFAAWLKVLSFQNGGAKVVFVAYPISFDFDYVLYYARKFLGYDPFDGKIVDMRSMAMGILGVNYDEGNKANMPAEWNAMETMSHIAVEDATQQADLFFAMLNASRRT